MPTSIVLSFSHRSAKVMTSLRTLMGSTTGESGLTPLFALSTSAASSCPIFSITAKEDGAEDFPLEDDSTASPEDSLVGGEVRREFWRAFELMPPKDREILALRHFRDLEYHEIAEELRIPIGTVMSRLFHARRRLRERLEPHLM